MGELLSMSDREYFDSHAIDQTSLKKYLVSPKCFAAYLTGSREPNAVLEFGKAAHSLVLGSGPIVLVKPNRRTKEGREEYERLLSENEGRDICWVSADDKTILRRMREECDYFSTLPGRPELALFADDPDTGVELKGKADWLPDMPDEDGVYRIRDYKTTGHSPLDFEKSAWQFGYHIQAAFYMRLYRLVTDWHGPLGFEFIVQEKTEPYDWMAWRFDEQSPEIGLAYQQIDHALQGIAWFLNNKENPVDAMRSYGLDKTPCPIAFPDWKLLELETEVESWR